MNKLSKMVKSLTSGDFKTSGWCGNRRKCVSVAIKPEGVAIRDTKDSTETTLAFNHGEWTAFITAVKAGEFDSKS